MAAQAGLCLAWSENPEHTFCRVVAQLDVFMACMVEGNPIIQAYWIDTSNNKIFTNWLFKVEEENSVGGFPLKLLKLTIRRNAFSDEEYCDYTCYVAGDHDEDTATVHLRRP